MADSRYPTTPALRALDALGIPWEGHTFPYVDKGGTRHSSAQLGVPEHEVIKTLVFEDDQKRPLIVLMHGDRSVSTKNLARQLHHLGVRSVAPCKPETAERHTGYQVGGTSPFGTRKALPIYAEATIFQLERLFINGGKRGFLVRITPQDLDRALAPTKVSVAID